MDKIFNQISNPFNFEGIKRILKLYIESNGGKEKIYSSIVQYHKDRDMTEQAIKVHTNNNHVERSTIYD